MRVDKHKTEFEIGEQVIFKDYRIENSEFLVTIKDHRVKISCYGYYIVEYKISDFKTTNNEFLNKKDCWMYETHLYKYEK